MMIPARAWICRENRWSTNVRIGLMSRNRIPGLGKSGWEVAAAVLEVLSELVV